MKFFFKRHEFCQRIVFIAHDNVFIIGHAVPDGQFRTAAVHFIHDEPFPFLPEFTGYKDAFAFVLLIVVLLVKPTGLLGKNQGEKV